MTEQIAIISGNIHVDARGSIKFINDFDMTAIKRFYIIENADTNEPVPPVIKRILSLNIHYLISFFNAVTE